MGGDKYPGADRRLDIIWAVTERRPYLIMPYHCEKPGKQLNFNAILRDRVSVHPVLDNAVVFFRHDEEEVEKKFKE